MKAKVDKSGCIACQLCTGICPEVFRMGADGFAEAYSEVTDATLSAAKEAEASCPVAVITVEEN